jgi:hypothetical protein
VLKIVSRAQASIAEHHRAPEIISVQSGGGGASAAVQYRG